MKILTVYGASDDLVEFDGIEGADEFNVYEENFYAGCWDVKSSLGSLRIHALYDGCWSFAVGQVYEEIPLPDWHVRVRRNQDINYSTLMEIEVPDDAVLVQKRGKR